MDDVELGCEGKRKLLLFWHSVVQSTKIGKPGSSSFDRPSAVLPFKRQIIITKILVTTLSEKISTKTRLLASLAFFATA